MTFDDDAPAQGPQAPAAMTQGQVVNVIRQIQDDLDVDYDTDVDGGKIETNVDKLTYGMREQVHEEYSSVSVISSMKQNGLGKSVLEYWGGRKLVPKRFSLERNFFFTGGLADIEEKTNALPIGDYLAIDELVELAYKREAMSGHVIDLNKWLAAKQRKTGVILWGAIPDFYLLDNYLREGKVDNYVECISRGIAVHFVADRFPHTDPWHSKELEEIQKRRKDGIHETTSKKVELLERHPCFKQMIFWTRMPDYAKTEYLDLVFKAAKLEPSSVKKRVIEDVSNELRLQYEKPMIRTSQAVANLANYLQIRGIPLDKILREAQIKPAEFKAMQKIASEKRIETILKIKKKPSTAEEQPAQEQPQESAG